MSWRRLFILIEGDADERFFSSIITPELSSLFNRFNFWQHSIKEKEKISKFIKSIKSMPNSDYLFVSDSDGKDTEKRKKNLLKKYDFLEEEKIVIVEFEIESWYMAGVTKKSSKKLGIPYKNSTNSFTKEDFKKQTPKKYNSRTKLMIDIIDEYVINEGRNSNTTFDKFCENCLPIGKTMQKIKKNPFNI